MGYTARARLALTAALLLPAFAAASPTVVISEFMPAPTGHYRYREFVELCNVSDHPVDLAGWELGDGEHMDAVSLPDTASPASLVLDAGAFAVVFPQAYFYDDELRYDTIPPDALVVSCEGNSIGSYGLSNDGARPVVLRSPDGLEQTVHYSAGEVFPGRSLEKLDLLADNQRDNWAPSAVLDGTPGAVNSLSAVEPIPPGALRITEIMPDPAGSREWIELTNTSEEPFLVTGCTVETAQGSAMVPAGTPPLARGAMLLLAQDAGALAAAFVTACHVTELYGFPPLSSSATASRSVWLRSPFGALVDSAHYPVPEPGRSLELVNLDKPGNEENWQVSWGDLHGTPGAPNRAWAPSPQRLVLTVNPHPPADTASISLELPNAPAELGIRIFDAAGRRVRTLENGQPALAHAHVHWDGRSNDGRLLPTGVYVLLVEAVSLTDGATLRATHTVVIARRR